MMTKAGRNFFPSEDSIKFVNIQKKNPITEERMYQQMALTASAMAFCWSKWNRQGADYNEIAFMAAEALTDEPVPEDAWSVFMATKHRVTKFLDTDDNGATREFKSNIYHLVVSTGSEAAVTRINSTSFLFVDSVYKLLTATRILSYA